MYRNHMGAKLAPTRIRCDELKVPSRDGTATMAGLSGSASFKGKTLTVTITNPSLDSAVAAQIRLTSGSLIEGRGSVLTHVDMTAHNTFERPDEVTAGALAVTIRGNRAEVSIPQRAVVSLELRIA
jgi:alpha-N-arabinofuranosidase